MHRFLCHSNYGSPFNFTLSKEILGTSNSVNEFSLSCKDDGNYCRKHQEAHGMLELAERTDLRCFGRSVI